MTDHLTPAATDDDRRLAREWAESIESATNSVESTTNPWSDRALAAARVILEAVPAPTPPTLADMTDEERFNAVGTWADVDGFHPYRAVIGGVPAPKVPVFKPTTGSLDWVRPEDVTPLPELGRAWNPGGSPTGTPAPTPAPALPGDWRLADHPKHGRVMVVRIFGDKAIYATPAEMLGIHTHVSLLNDLTYLDTDQETHHDHR